MNGEACCGSCAQGGVCAVSGAPRTLGEVRVVQIGAVSSSTVAGVPVVSSLGGLAGAFAGWWLGKKFFGRSTAGKAVVAAAGAYAGYKALPMATDAAGI